jgi:hypothetical protein
MTFAARVVGLGPRLGRTLPYHSPAELALAQASVDSCAAQVPRGR